MKATSEYLNLPLRQLGAALALATLQTPYHSPRMSVLERIRVAMPAEQIDAYQGELDNLLFVAP